jgi:hypothetical protein
MLALARLLKVSEPLTPLVRWCCARAHSTTVRFQRITLGHTQHLVELVLDVAACGKHWLMLPGVASTHLATIRSLHAHLRRVRIAVCFPPLLILPMLLFCRLEAC